MPLLSYLRGFGPAAQSAFVRRAYTREAIGELSFTFPMAMLEAGVVIIIAKLLFQVGSFGLATIAAAPMFANLTSTLWARLLRGRPKATMMALFQGVVLALLVGIALLPAGPGGASLLVVFYVLARCLCAGVLTARSVIWRANYPRHSRSRITGRIMMIGTVMLALLPVAAAALFDEFQRDHPWLFTAVFLGAALIGTVSVVTYAGLRVRRERVLRREERLPTIGSGDTPGPPLRVSAIRVLLDDHLFRGYMVWQFFSGLATMAGNTAMLAFIADQAATLPEDWKLDLPGPLDIKAYMIGIFFTTALVQLFVALSLPFWAHYLDKVHVTRFRTRHGLLWITTQATSLVVAYLAAVHDIAFGLLLVLLVVPRISQGLVFGGGRLAWQLGHHDFADRHLAATYMGIHQTLTGIRGFVAPFFGVLLYTGWDTYDNLLGTGLTIGAWHGIGYWVFVLTLALSIIGWAGFVRLDKQVGGDGAAKAHD